IRPCHLESLPGFILIRTCSPFWLDLASTEYPQRLGPQGSIRTLPSFSSVSQRPIGEVADGANEVVGAGVGCAGAAAMTGAGAGVAAGAVSCWICGAGALAGGCVDVEVSAGATLAVVVEGSGEGFTGAAAGSVRATPASGAGGSILVCCGGCLRGRSISS